MAASPLANAVGPVRIAITSGGRPLADTVQVISVEVVRAANAFPTARLVVADGDMPTTDWPVADSPVFAPGAAITVRAGYGARDDEIFQGWVVAAGLSVTGDNQSRLIVECEDPTGEPSDPAGPAALSVTWGVDLVSFESRHTGQGAGCGKVAFQGSALAQIGGLIELAGLGAVNSGTVVVSGVTHHIADGDWRTEVAFG